MGTNTGIGIGIGIPFRNSALGGDNIYFPPELKARMIGVWDNYGKKNTDADRNIIKNKIPNAGGDLEILNAAYEGMSGCNGYPVVFGANKTWENLSSVYSYTSDVTSTTIHITRVKNAGTGLLFSYVKKDGALTNIREIPAFRVTVKGLEGNSKFGYRYLATEDATVETLVYLGNGTHELSKSFAPTEALLDLTRNAWVGIFITPMVEGEVVFDCDITIEVLPEYEGAFVTDGVNDMIISQKTIAEMGITDEVTIVSMIHQITLNSTYGNGFTNYIENLDKSTYVRNNIYKAGKTGIYGYSVSLINRTGSNINNILGDKNDYGFEVANRQNTLNASKLSIIGRATGFNEISSIAHYWTFAVLGKATADEINLIIAKYNLDRTLRPDILCNITKQGITNDNHADFNDRLIDYSGNGRDIQMYNLAWKGGSGIAAKQYETFKDWTNTPYQTSTVTEIDEFTRVVDSTSNAYWVSMINRTSDFDKVHDSINIVLYQDDMLLVHECKYKIDENVTTKALYETLKSGVNTITLATIDKFTDIPEDAEIMSLGEWVNPKSNKGSVKITLLPSYEGGVLLDGINDFGKVTGMPIYKDYTFIIDYERISYTSEGWGGAIVSKSPIANNGAFISMMANSAGLNKQLFSFGGVTAFIKDDLSRILFWQTKYKSENTELTVGEGVDGDTLWLGTLRDNDFRFFNGAIYSLMSFPYSMSKFLIERQLKKHKLGTLYPNMVEFRPVIKANANYNIFYTALLPLTGDIWERINIGDYVPVGRRIAIQMSFDNEASELVSAISSQLGNISITKNSNNKGYTIFGDILKNKSPQKINITIDEYIRYEDIVQPYPVLLRFNDENGNEVSWGGKFRIGSTITRIGSAADSNLLPNIYNIFGLLLNDNQVTSSKVIVEKTMVFKAKSAYIFDNNEPKVILSPSRLRIPNSSYKILGYIPDISGHGNHGVIHNSAYKLNSGANGYLVDFTTFQDDGIKGIVRTDSKIYLDKSFNYNQGFWLGRTNSPSPAYKVKISGIPETGMLTYTGGIWLNLVNGINELPARTNTEEEHGFVAQSPNLDWSNLVIEQIGEYEGAYCLDGVDDFVTIPTLSSGGKQVLMKVNWNTLNSVLYDQRNGIEVPFCIGTGSGTIAYNHRNVGGNTFIDGILNNHILTDDLQAITHNIVLNNDYNVTNSNLFIGTNYIKSIYTKMALYDFMLFDNISTDDKIKELNEYVGIEAKVELPPYYWDAYGKTNLDEDKATIQQRGVAVGDYDLTNYNHAYDKMSGYGGYNLGRFDKSWASSSSSNTSIKVVQRNPYDITLKKLGGNSDWEFNNTELKVISNPVSVKFKSNKNIRVTCDYHYYPVGGNSEGTPLGITSKDLIANKDAIITISPISQENIDKYNIDVNRGYYLIYFQLSSTLAVNEEVTIEMLPLYPNGLVYDGVTDYSENANIPAFTDFTYILKRQILKGIANSAVMYKGNITVNQGGAFICNYCEPSDTNLFTDFSFGGLLRSNDIDKPIIYGTKTSVNGDSITPGENIDTVGINVGKWVNYLPMVLYKLILYPKTIPLLQINFLKNLMERDEIIDLDNSIFKK
jgi:hypothetical protein